MEAQPVTDNIALAPPVAEQSSTLLADQPDQSAVQTHHFECAGGCSPSHARLRKVLTSIVMCLLITLSALALYCIWSSVHG